MHIRITEHKIELDGNDITDSVHSFEVKSFRDSPTEVKLTLLANVDVDLESHLLKLEKKQHVRFAGLDQTKHVFIRSR